MECGGLLLDTLSYYRVRCLLQLRRQLAILILLLCNKPLYIVALTVTNPQNSRHFVSNEFFFYKPIVLTIQEYSWFPYCCPASWFICNELIVQLCRMNTNHTIYICSTNQVLYYWSDVKDIYHPVWMNCQCPNNSTQRKAKRWLYYVAIIQNYFQKSRRRVSVIYELASCLWRLYSVLNEWLNCFLSTENFDIPHYQTKLFFFSSLNQLV